MKGYLKTTAARRAAWITLTAFWFALLAPMSQRRADAQTVGARTAYLVPFTSAEGIDAEISQRATNELAAVIRKARTDAGVGQPIELITLSLRNPVIRQAIEDGMLTEDQVLNPPTDRDTAIDFARALGLTTVLVGTIESYTEAEDRGSATIDATVIEWYVPAQADLEPSITQTVSKSSRVSAADEGEKALLRTTVTSRLAQSLAASLLDAPYLAPAEAPTPTAAPTTGKKSTSPLWIALGVVGGVALLFLLASLGGGDDNGGGGPGSVQNVQALSEEDSVRVTWDPVAGAVGYNVYRRPVGNQTIRSRSRQTASSYEVLVNPETGTTPTVVGSGRTSFIDNTGQNGIVYEYAVAAVGANNSVGGLSTATAASQSGPNIGTAPTLTASSGNGFISLNWTASSGFVDGYVIFRRQGGEPNIGANSPDELIRVGNVTFYDDTTVQNGVSYTYIVQPLSQVNVNGLLTGQASNPVTVTASSGAAPQAPRNVTASVTTAGLVQVSWQANPEANIDFYEILFRRDRSRSFRSPATGRAPWLRGLSPEAAARAQQEVVRSDPRASRQLDLTGFQIAGVVEQNVTTFTYGPLPDGTYTFAVRAVNTSGQRGPATAAPEVTVNAALAPPAGVTAVGLDARVRLTWQPVAGDVAGYNIYRSQSPITAAMTGPATAPGIARVGQVGANQNTFDDTNLTNNATFYYAVTSVDSQGAESLFGKGGATTTGAIGIPHATPASMTFEVSAQNLSGNGKSTARLTVTVRDAQNVPASGVEVLLTTDGGTFVNLPANSTQIDTAGRQIRALTDGSGQVVVDLRSDVVVAAGAQQSVNIQARVPELPDNIELESRTISFLASRPTVIALTPGQSQLTADNASTTDVTARVLDALGNPVPDNQFSVDFLLNSTNGAIRPAGNVQQNPFQPGAATVNVPVVNGQAVAVYRAGNDASQQGSPPPNIVPIQATVRNLPSVTSQTLITLVPGAASRIDFGTASVTLARGQSTTLTLTVRDAQNNPVRAGVTVNFTTQPDGVITVPQSAQTDNNGQIQIQITAGQNAGGAVIVATIAGTQLQNQLAVTVQ